MNDARYVTATSPIFREPGSHAELYTHIRARIAHMHIHGRRDTNTTQGPERKREGNGKGRMPSLSLSLSLSPPLHKLPPLPLGNRRSSEYELLSGRETKNSRTQAHRYALTSLGQSKERSPSLEIVSVFQLLKSDVSFSLRAAPGAGYSERDRGREAEKEGGSFQLWQLAAPIHFPAAFPLFATLQNSFFFFYSSSFTCARMTRPCSRVRGLNFTFRDCARWLNGL